MKFTFSYKLLLLIALLFLAVNVQGQETFLDTFSNSSYSNNDGTQNFSNNWVEQNEGTNPNNGRITINNGALRFDDIDNRTIYRFIPLAGANSVTLTLDYNASARGGENLGVYIYNTDTGTLNLVQDITLPISGSISYNLTAAEIASNPAIYFASTSGNWGNNDIITIDNVLFTANYGPSVTITDVTVDEGAGTATFTATHTGQSTFVPFTVNYVTNAITATDGVDYNAASGTMVFTGIIGATQTITVNILDDPLYELVETFEIQMTSSSNGSVDITDLGIGTITDNEVVLGNTPLALFDEFDGYMDYATTGGSMRTQDNNTNSCAITTTSANTLTSNIPAGALVEKAVLYWTNSGQMDPIVTFEGVEIDAGLVYRTTFGGSLEFHNQSADVTSIVQAIPDPSTNVFDFSGLTIDNTGSYCGSTTLGGWVLMVFYSAPGLPASTINLYQGFDANQNTTTTFGLSGFYAIGSLGSKTTVLSWEGDQSLANNESLRFNTPLTGNNLLTGDGDNGPGDNPFNSTIYDNVGVPTVNDATQYGLDLDTYDVSSFILPGESSATTEVRVGQDLVFMNVVLLKVPSNIVVGNVFEDINYGGGAGRNKVSASGVGIPNATVELYDNLGALVFTTTTDATGQYTFAGMQNGTYTARVVNNTVRSTRPNGNSCASCIPIQTFKADYVGSAVNPNVNKVGGNTPSAADPGAGTLMGAQSTATISIANEGAVGIDFGFNFNAIVNTNETGQGSLEQFIVNSNEIGSGTLDIEANALFDPAAGDDLSVFMIPPSGDALGRTADTNYVLGVFRINIVGGDFSDINGDTTIIDGRTQTAYSGDSNNGTIGAGGTSVGVGATSLPNYQFPEIQIDKPDGEIFINQGTNNAIRYLSLTTNDKSAFLAKNGSLTIANNLIGISALGANGGDMITGIEIEGGDIVVDGNYIASTIDNGVFIDGGNTTTIRNNHFANNGNADCKPSIEVKSGDGIVIQTNLIENSGGLGIDAENISSPITIDQNTVTTSGFMGGGCLAGILLGNDDATVTGNIIHTNAGAGLELSGNGSGNLISQNSFYANGTAVSSLGIDLDQDGVTLNDSGDGDNGPNNLLNFPVIEFATISGSNLSIKGWARPGATIELFISDVSEGTASAGDNMLGFSSDYGEGQTYFATVIEGSASDLSGVVSNYTDMDGNSDTTNKFQFSIPIPAGVDVGDFITTTATVSNSTSEFSPLSIIKVNTIITNRRITHRVNKN